MTARDRATEVFHRRSSVQQVEEGSLLSPSFDDHGLLPCVTTDADSGEVLMLGWMDRAAPAATLHTGQAHYWSRSRRAVWRKGETSGMVQSVVELRVDDDQDAVWLRVRLEGLGASCHVGYRSCFYRAVPLGKNGANTSAENLRLVFTETHKVFDPAVVYRDMPNPTRL